MDEVSKNLAQAVLACDFDQAKQRLSEGASPNGSWGTLPLITHAALLHHPAIFKLLVDSGANVPETLLPDVINWELGDWRLDSDEDEDDLIAILQMVRSTKAWLPADQRRKLAEGLKGYNLSKLVTTLIEDAPEAHRPTWNT
jgi:hypothetical protein